jgi:hypothetical protein
MKTVIMEQTLGIIFHGHPDLGQKPNPPLCQKILNTYVKKTINEQNYFIDD